MSSWLFFGLLAPILWGLSNTLGGAVRRKYVKNDYALTWFVGLMRLPFVLVLLLIHPVHFEITASSLMLMLAGVLWVVPFILYYYALNFEEPSRIALYLQFVEIFTLVLSFFLLHERLTQNQWLAFVLLFSGGVLAAFKKLKEKWHFSKMIILIAIGCIFWALSDVLFRKYSLSIGDFWTSFSWYFIGSFLVAIPMLLFQRRGNGFFGHFRGLPLRGYVLLFADQIIGTGGSVMFAYALHSGLASLTAVLQAVQPLSAFCFALFLPYLIPEIDHENRSQSTLILKGISFLLILGGLIALSLQ